MHTLSWSPEAEARFERWLAPRLTLHALDGADPAEVADAWRLHVQEELARRGEETSDAAAFDRVLAGLDVAEKSSPPPLPVPPPPASFSPPSPSAAAASPARGDAAAFQWPKVFLFFGVIWPLLTIVAEALFGLCAGTFFDPLPTWGHLAVVGATPLVLWVLYRAVQYRQPWWLALARPATGFMLAVALYYVMALGGLLVVAGMGLVFGIFALPLYFLPWMTLSPVFILLAALFGLRRLTRAQRLAGQKRRGLGLGFALGLVALLAVEGPRWWTHLLLADAVSGDPEISEPAIHSLRRWGTAEVVHRACFENRDFSLSGSDPASWLLSGSAWDFDGPRRSVDVRPDQARVVFYRMTGKSFNEVKPRRMRMPIDVMGTGRADRARATQWVWDGERGGDAVGARLPGLALASSHLEWHVEGGPRLAYGEWTMEFTNAHANDQEARGQVLLPPGACVSRLTLWINDQPEEAAFAATARVKAAYKEVVTVERRDPVLVTQVGPDRVLVQCFPVPRDGGRMKIRLGLTAPLDDGGRLWQPSFIERNFSMPETLRHAVWVQSRDLFEPPAGAGGSLEKGANDTATWQAELPHAALARTHLRWTAPETNEIFWCEDALAVEGESRFVLGQWHKMPFATLTQLFVVIDGSAGLREHRDALVRALSALPGTVRTRVWLTTDEGARELAVATLATELSADHFLGGQNAAPGLKAALAAARETTEPAAIVWLHGPQPAELPGVEALEQALTRSLRPIPLYALALAPGPHRLLEKLYRAAALRSGDRLTNDPASLTAALQHLIGRGYRLQLRVTRADTAPSDGVHVSDHLARHAAYAETLAAFHAGSSDTETLAARAARHQIVSPYSGAVVLERQDQYARHGLSQVDPSSVPKVPTIPEPGLLGLGAAGLLLALRRKRA